MKKWIVSFLAVAMVISGAILIYRNSKAYAYRCALAAIEKKEYYTAIAYLRTLSGYKNADELFGDVFAKMNRDDFAVTLSGRVIYRGEDGNLGGDEELIRRVQALYSGEYRQYDLDSWCTVLGEDGQIYSEFEATDSEYTSISVEQMNFYAKQIFDINETEKFRLINQEFAWRGFLAVTEEGELIGFGKGELEPLHSLWEGGERIIYLSQHYFLTEAGNVYYVDLEVAPLIRKSKLSGRAVTIAAWEENCIAVLEDGTVEYIQNERTLGAQEGVDTWTDIIAVEMIRGYCVGLQRDGTLVVSGNQELAKEAARALSEWTDVVAIASDGFYHVAGLRSNGEVLVFEAEYYN